MLCSERVLDHCITKARVFQYTCSMGRAKIAVRDLTRCVIVGFVLYKQKNKNPYLLWCVRYAHVHIVLKNDVRGRPCSVIIAFRDRKGRHYLQNEGK
jgi:hypothetical protein